MHLASQFIGNQSIEIILKETIQSKLMIVKIPQRPKGKTGDFAVFVQI